jgi:hypothetical protein
MFQHSVSLSRRWPAILASCVLSIVMLMTVLPSSAHSRPAADGIASSPPAASLRAGSSQYTKALPGTESILAAGVNLTAAVVAQANYPGAAVSYLVYLKNTSTSVNDSYKIELSGFWDDDAPSQVNSVSPGQSITFTVTVTVAQDAPGGDENVTTVKATSHNNPSKYALLGLTTTALNVYGVDLTPPASAQLGNPGATLSYALTVMNTGNMTDSYTVTTSSAYLISAPASVDLLSNNETAPLIVSMTVPSSALAGTTNVAAITVTSYADNAKFSRALVTTTVNAVYSLTLAAPIYAKSGGLGTAVNYLAQVTNLGNVADVFTLTVAGNWTATISGSATLLVSLPAFSNADVNVVVNIPPNVIEYSSDMTTLTATSRGKPALTTSATFTTTGRTVKVYLPIALNNWPPPWSKGSGDLATKTVYQIAVCSKDATRLYAGTTAAGVYASTDAGSSWSQTSLSGVLVRGVAVNPANCDEAYAFAWGQGVMKTTDGGAHWSPVNSGLGELYGYAVAISPLQPQTVYVGANTSGVYSSTDGGAHWSHTAIPNAVVLGLSIGADGAVYAATFSTGVYRLKDGIAQALNGGDLSATANVLAVAAASPSTLFAATETGLYRSTTSGSTWTSVLSGTGRVFSVLINPQDAQIVYAGVEFSGVWRSVDGGLTFNSYSQGMPAGVGIRNVAIGSVASNYLHAGTVLNGAWRVAYP